MKCDILVIGAGPAGLSAASYSARAGYECIVVGNMGPGGQLMFIDKIENYPGVNEISGYELAEILEKQCDAFGAKIEYLEATEIRKTDSGFVVKAGAEEIETRAIIVAAGADHKKLSIPGENEYTGRGVSYCATCDGPFFKNKNITVVGGGDTALTDALYLSKICKEVTIIHRRDQFRAQKLLQDRIKAIDNIKTIMGCNVLRINGNNDHVSSISLSNGDELSTDGVFILIGTTPNSSIVKDICNLDNGYIVANDEMETSCRGIFAAGDVRNTPFRQVVTATSDGAIASHSADEYLQGVK